MGRTRTYRYRGAAAIGLAYTDALAHPYTVLSSVRGTKVVDFPALEHDGFDVLGPPHPDVTQRADPHS